MCVLILLVNDKYRKIAVNRLIFLVIFGKLFGDKI